MIRNLDEVKEIGFNSKAALENGTLKEYGEILNYHWSLKKRSNNMSNKNKLFI